MLIFHVLIKKKSVRSFGILSGIIYFIAWPVNLLKHQDPQALHSKFIAGLVLVCVNITSSPLFVTRGYGGGQFVTKKCYVTKNVTLYGRQWGGFHAKIHCNLLHFLNVTVIYGGWGGWGVLFEVRGCFF